MVVLGMVLVHRLSASAAEIGFKWGSSCSCLVSVLVLPSALVNLAGAVQHFQVLLFLMLGVIVVAADLCGRKGFRGATFAGYTWLSSAPLFVSC